MKKFKVKDIRKLKKNERNIELNLLYQELLKERSAYSTGGSLTNPGRIKTIKKTIARFLTIEKEESK